MTELVVLDVRMEQTSSWRRELQLEGLASYIGDECAEQSRKFVPVDTGALKGSIRYDVQDGATSTDARVEYSANTYYAIYVERGTARAPAQPFLLPALKRGVDAALRAWRPGRKKPMKSGRTITAKQADRSRTGAVADHERAQAAEAAQTSAGSP